MRFRAVFQGLVLACLVFAGPEVGAGSILIINGAAGTSESDTTAAITSNLDSLLIAAGNTTTISNGVPGDISSYDQIWDIRFSDNLAITNSEQTQFVAFLNAGGGMFVMGENAGFATRNNSVLSLISAAGGGSLTFTEPTPTQTVVAPFTGPNAIADGNVAYIATGGVTTAGTGQFITLDEDTGYGTGIAFGVGDLANALMGSLTAIFDANFMQAFWDQPDSQSLLKNLISYIEGEVNPAPIPGTAYLLGIGLVGLASLRRKKLAA